MNLNHPLERVRSFKYLGMYICCNGRSLHEIKIGSGQEKKAFTIKDTDQQVYNIQDKEESPGLYTEPITTYGSVAWAISKVAYNIINAAELWFLRRIQTIPYTEHATNEAVLAKAGVKRRLLVNIRKRQAHFFGHVMRINELEHQVTMGKINGKRRRRRQRVTHPDGMTKWIEKETSNEVIHSVQDTVEWRPTIVNAGRHDT